MTRCLNLILLATLLVGCSSAERDMQEKKANVYFTRGTSELVNGNYTQALDSLIKAEQLSDKRSDIKNNLGMAYYFKGDKATAVRKIKEALKLDEKNTDARSNLASIYLEAKKYKTARKYYKEILKDLTYPKQFQKFYFYHPNLHVL